MAMRECQNESLGLGIELNDEEMRRLFPPRTPVISNPHRR